MLWEKIHRDSKTGDISQKDNPVVNMPFVTVVACNLILGIALLLSGGVSQAAEENLIADKAFEVTQPEFLGITEPEFMGITQPDFLGASEPESLKVSNPKSLKEGEFPKGKYTPAERENPAYDRCAKEKGFDDRYQCALKALGTTQE
jgi:hypothetical protein